MATMMPNSANESMQNLTQMLVSMVMENKRLALEAERVGIQRSQLDLERERTEQAAQGAALDRLLAFAPFLPRGQSIAETPQIHSTMQQAFPEFDPANPGDLGGIVLNEETMETLLRPMIIARFEGLPQEQKDMLLERAGNRAILGTPSSGEELQAQGTRAQIYLESWSKLRQDPVALDNILRTNMGLDPIIRVQYGDRVLEFDTSAAASLTTQLMQHRDQMSLGWANFNLRQQEIAAANAARASSGQLDLAGELMSQMEKHGVSLGRASAMQIVRAYDETSRLAREGKLTDANNPMRNMYQNSPPEVQAALQVFDGAASFGDSQMNLFLRQSPEGQQLLNFLSVGEQLHNAGIPSENIPGMLENLTETFQATGPGGVPLLPRYTEPGYFGRGNRLNFLGPPAPAAGPTGTDSTTAPGAAPAGSAGRASREQIATQMRNDARALAEGRLTVQQINQRYPDAMSRAAVVRQSRTYRRGN